MFATTGATADELYPIVWEAIKRIELLGLEVMSITCNGASPNKKFFNMFKSNKREIAHKTRNIYADDDCFIYFFVDAPHKTARNCFSQSFGHSHTRALWVSLLPY